MQTIKEKGETKVLSGKSENFELMYNEDMKCHYIEVINEIRVSNSTTEAIKTGISLDSKQDIVILALNPDIPYNPSLLPANTTVNISLHFTRDCTLVKGNKFMFMYIEDQDEITEIEEIHRFAKGKGLEVKDIVSYYATKDEKITDVVPSMKMFSIDKSLRPDVELTSHIRKLTGIFHIFPTLISWNRGYQFYVSVDELKILKNDLSVFSSNEAIETAIMLIGIFVPTSDEWEIVLENVDN